MAKILITGVHGFVGSNLVDRLRSDHQIYGLDIVNKSQLGVIHTYEWFSLKDCNLPQFDVIIHLAGMAKDSKHVTEYQKYLDINWGLTKEIFDYFSQINSRKFIFFSTVKAAADEVLGDYLTEEAIPSPKGPYGESKLAAEEYIQNNQSGKREVYILRPAMIHGPGNRGNLNMLYKLVKKGIPWIFGSFENKRSFASVDNVCYVVQRLVDGSIPSGVYNIADDESLSTNDLVKVISSNINKPYRIWFINRRMIQFFATLGSFCHLPFNNQVLAKLTSNYVVSNKKIKNILGIINMPTTCRKGLEKTLDSFK